MEVLPSSNSLFTPQTAVDCSPIPRSASFRLSRASMRPQSAPRTRVSVFKEDKNWLGKLSLAISDYELYVSRKPVTSQLLTLSPIVASPICPPTPTFSSVSSSPNSPASTEYATAPNSPFIPPPFAPLSSTPPLAGFQDSSESLRATALSLLASASFSAIVPPGEIDGAAALPETPHRMRPMKQRLRSFSDPSLSPRQAVIVGDSGRPGALLHSVFPESYVEDNNIPSLRKRATFHIPNVEEDVNPSDRSERANRDSSLEDNYGSSDVDSDSVQSRDIARRFHALRELLATEYGYLNDLKILVNVYLRDLPAMALRAQCLTRIPSFLATGTRIGSHSSQLCSQPLETDSWDRSRLTQRRCFSENEVGILTRNAVDLLHLHEGLLQELEATVNVFGNTVNPQLGEDVSGHVTLANLDVAIQAVAQKFQQQASHFHIYQVFCAGHLEALEIVRMKQHQYPVEWDAFEHHCASVILAQMDENDFGSKSQCSPGSLPGNHETITVSGDRKRTASLTALDGAMRSLRVFASRESVSSHFYMRLNKHARRLTFMDYLIKPIQRICKYPLLLDQLRPRGSSQGVALNVDVTVEESIQAIRSVVAAVDEARRQKEIATKSSLIASRILLSSTSGCSHRLSKVFLSSLGTCLLASSLVMMYRPLTEPKRDFANAKPERVGVFLYPGGYLILVRVLKGRIYEPKHWFCLANEFDIHDVADDASYFSSSFCLFSKFHVFEFAAACPGERTFWVSTIFESLTQSPVWADEPISSLGSMNLRETHLDRIRPDFLNTQSNYGRRPCHEGQLGDTSSAPDDSTQDDVYFKQDCTLGSTRASSSTSVKSMFIQNVDLNTTIVRRSSTTINQQTIDGLQDVVWRACLGGRACGHHNRQEMPQEAKTKVSSFIRSNSAVSLKGLARKRLSKDDTGRISRHNSLPHGGHSTTNNTELVKRRGDHENSCGIGESANFVIHNSSSPLPVPDIHTNRTLSPSPTSLTDAPTETTYYFSRSLFRNVKDLFHARSTNIVDNSTPSLQQSSLQRAKSASHLFRRLSSRRLFQRNKRDNTDNEARTGPTT